MAFSRATATGSSLETDVPVGAEEEARRAGVDPPLIQAAMEDFSGRLVVSFALRRVVPLARGRLALRGLRGGRL